MKSPLIVRNIQLLTALCLFALCALPAAQAAETNRPASRWEKEISAFEASDKTNFPPKHAILFVGSSTIRIWKTLAQDFPDKQVINRGFGGSEISDSVELADRIVFPYEPKLILLYAGDNDLAAGKSAAKVVSDYRDFVAKVHRRLPDAKILFIAVKPSVLRWKLKDKIETVNREIAGMTGYKIGFIDIYKAMLDKDGNPRPELFQKDGLHMNKDGYAIWIPIIKPYLD